MPARDGDGEHLWIPPSGGKPGDRAERLIMETIHDVSHRLEREPLRTSGNESVCLFSVAGLWRASRDQKSPPPSLL
jgi:hypothetical protein